MRNHFEFLRCGARVIVALAFCSLGISKAAAQEGREYVPFVEEGKVWYCAFDHPYDVFPITPEDPEGVGIDCVFTMCGDTLINEREYKKVYCQFEGYYGDKERHYYCAVREEAYQVFIIEEETMEEKLIYDFSAPEKLITITYNDCQLGRSGGGRYYDFPPRQKFYEVGKLDKYRAVDCNDSSYWMDGVGAPLNNPFAFELCCFPFDKPRLGKDIEVITCMKDGKYVFKREWLAGPVEPASIGDNIYVGNYGKDRYLYNLQGIRIDNVPSSGIYIQNGRKYVVR